MVMEDGLNGYLRMHLYKIGELKVMLYPSVMEMHNPQNLKIANRKRLDRIISKRFLHLQCEVDRLFQYRLKDYL